MYERNDINGKIGGTQMSSAVAGRSRPRSAAIRLGVPFAAISVAALAWQAAKVGSPSVVDRLDHLAASAGIGLAQVEITGHRFAADSDILEALDAASVNSFVRFDSREACRLIEQVSWIKTARLSRILPDRLTVTVTEREAFAVWHDDKRTVLVDSTGRELSAVAANARPDLPRLAGQGAPATAAHIFQLLDRHAELRGMLHSLTRVADRRWTLTLAGNRTVHLPAGRESAALELLTREHAGGALLQRSFSLLDLRNLERVVVRP